jgi:hypothetical protein
VNGTIITNLQKEKYTEYMLRNAKEGNKHKST